MKISRVTDDSGDQPLSQFASQRFIALETYKRNGEGVKSPIWFVERAGKLYIWTFARSWKVRRIRSNPKVRISPSSVRGNPKGSWVEAKARPIETEAYAPIIDMLRKKYGFQFWLFSHLHGKERVIIEIEPSPSA